MLITAINKNNRKNIPTLNITYYICLTLLSNLKAIKWEVKREF